MSYCVYKHTCPNSKVYIGITGKNPIERWKNGQGYFMNTHFYNAILKYGWDNIKHEILFTDLSTDEAYQKEIELIKLYKSNNPEYGYNKSTGGECGSKGCYWSEENKKHASESHFGKHLSEEHRRKIGEGNKGKTKIFTEEHIKHLSEAHKGIHPSEETRKKMSESNKGKNHPLYGKHHLEETKERLRLANTGSKNPVSKKVMNLDTNEIFESIMIASRTYNISDSGIGRCCRGTLNKCGGYHWKYVDEVDK